MHVFINDGNVCFFFLNICLNVAQVHLVQKLLPNDLNNTSVVCSGRFRISNVEGCVWIKLKSKYTKRNCCHYFIIS